MAHFKEKLKGFVFGLVLGLILAGGFFVYKLDNYFRGLAVMKRATLNESEKELVVDKPLTVVATKETTKKIKAESPTNLSNPTLSNMAVENKESEDSTSATADLASTSIASEEGTETVQRDRLLTRKRVALKVISEEEEVEEGVEDSLLAKLADVQPVSGQSNYMLELWESPLNYVGYKVINKKILLYGITPEDSVAFYELGKNIYLRSKKGVFRLDQKGDFERLENIFDSTLVAKLK